MLVESRGVLHLVESCQAWLSRAAGGCVSLGTHGFLFIDCGNLIDVCVPKHNQHQLLCKPAVE